MKRRYILSEDDSPQNVYVEFTTADTSGEYFYETGDRVTYAIIGQSNVITSSVETTGGPYFFSGDEAGGGPIYNIKHADITNDANAVYAQNSLQVFLNGQQLTRDVDYEEILDGSDYYRFQIIDVGTTGLLETPGSNDQLSIVYKIPTTINSLTGNEFLRISSLYPDLVTGFTISYENFNIGETIKLDIIYR